LKNLTYEIKLFYLMIFAFFAKINFAQNSVNAAVVAVIEQGG
jgi:hypothetical protein